MGFIRKINKDGIEEFVNENYDALKAEAESAPVTSHIITEEEEKSFYKIRRSNDYPSIGDQFDALWHAIDEGTLDKTSSDFYTMIKAVKDKYPKG